MRGSKLTTLKLRLTRAFFYSRSLPVFFFFSTKPCWIKSFLGPLEASRTRPVHCASIIGRLSLWVTRFSRILVVDIKLWFPGPFSKRKTKMRVHIRLVSTCSVFRVCGVIVRMPYLPLRKVGWANSIWLSKSTRSPATYCLSNGVSVTTLLKHCIAVERVDLLDDHDFPARTITETVLVFCFDGRDSSLSLTTQSRESKKVFVISF